MGREPRRPDLCLIILVRWPRPKSDQPLYTQEYVRQAVSLYEASGRGAAVAYYNDSDSVDGQWYMFIVDETGLVVAHGANQDLVGMAVVDVKGENDYPSGRIVADDADEDGEWVRLHVLQSGHRPISD